jgi:hypothetical protein
MKCTKNRPSLPYYFLKGFKLLIHGLINLLFLAVIQFSTGNLKLVINGKRNSLISRFKFQEKLNPLKIVPFQIRFVHKNI